MKRERERERERVEIFQKFQKYRKMSDDEMNNDSSDSGYENEVSSDDDETREIADGETARHVKKLKAFGGAMSEILGRKSQVKKGVVLSKKTTKHLKELKSEKEEKSKTENLKRDRRKLLDKDLVIPTLKTGNYEKALRKIATRGVVTLFNAIRTHQKAKEDDSGSKKGKKRKRKEVSSSKAKFLEMLKQQKKNSGGKNLKLGGEDVTVASTAGDEKRNEEEEVKKNGEGWDVLREDMLTGAKMKDWDKLDGGNSKSKGKKVSERGMEDPEEAALWRDVSSSDDE